ASTILVSTHFGSTQGLAAAVYAHSEMSRHECRDGRQECLRHALHSGVLVPIAPARTTAFDILRKVEKGGYASDLLLLQSAALDSRDAGLASEIVFGVLRYQAQLDYLIGHYSGRHQRFDSEVRIALRMGIYQLRYLQRIPAHAAVTDAVELV